MQKEEEQQRIALDNLIQRVTELKNSVGALIFKLEHEYETLKWPSVLDNYSLLSSQLQSLGKLLKGDKMPQLKNKILLPIFISPEPDESLAKLTENRVMMFNHEVAPSFLRTKPPPDVEEKTGLLTGKAQQLPQDQTQKQLNNLNKVTSNLLDIINSTRDDWDNDPNLKANQSQTTSMADTNALIGSMVNGKLFQSSRPGRLPESPQPGMAQNNRQSTAMTKAPSAIKTTIKTSVNAHPYQRN